MLKLISSHAEFDFQQFPQQQMLPTGKQGMIRRERSPSAPFSKVENCS